MNKLNSDRRCEREFQNGAVASPVAKMEHSTPDCRTEDGSAELPKVVWPDVQPSLRSRVLDQLLLLTGRKKWWASAAVVQQRVRKLALRPASHCPVRLGRKVGFDLRFAEEWPVYDVHLANKIGARHHVVFLHGGAYVHEIVGSHWNFVGRLVQETGCHCAVPIYPLAPRGIAKEVVPTTGRLLSEFIQKFGSENVTVIGNSAGGGLALAAAQWLRDAGHSQPTRLILICPGVNGALDRCESVDADRDVMQDVPGMIEAFRLYAGDLDIRHPFVSPLNGAFGGLAPMLIFNGTHDLYCPDIMELAGKAATAGVRVEMHVRNGLQHNYPLLPTPEGSEVRELIASAIADAAVQADHEAAVALSTECGSSAIKAFR